MSNEKEPIDEKSVLSINLDQYLNAVNQQCHYPLTQIFKIVGLSVQTVLREGSYEENIKKKLAKLAPEGTEVILDYSFRISPLFDNKGGVLVIADGNAIVVGR